jgi:hypothetical protein
MKDFYHKELDQEGTGQTKSQLYIYMDSKTNTIGFGCDWEDGNEGTDSISEIFFQLTHKNLIQQILAVLYKQCVIEDRISTFNEILQKIHSKILDSKEEDTIVIKPTAQGATNV